MLDNPFPVPSLCNWTISTFFFIQISKKVTWKQLILFRVSHEFFEVIPCDLDLSVNFKITQRFLLRWPVFPDYLFVSCDYDAMQIIRLIHVCISLFYHQIKTYKQNSQKKWITISILSITPTGIYLFKVNNGKTRKTCKIRSKLVIKISAWSQWRNRTD